MKQNSINVACLVELTIKLRDVAREDFEIPETSNFNILVFI